MNHNVDKVTNKKKMESGWEVNLKLGRGNFNKPEIDVTRREKSVREALVSTDEITCIDYLTGEYTIVFKATRITVDKCGEETRQKPVHAVVCCDITEVTSIIDVNELMYALNNIEELSEFRVTLKYTSESGERESIHARGLSLIHSMDYLKDLSRLIRVSRVGNIGVSIKDEEGEGVFCVIEDTTLYEVAALLVPNLEEDLHSLMLDGVSSKSFTEDSLAVRPRRALSLPWEADTGVYMYG